MQKVECKLDYGLTLAPVKTQFLRSPHQIGDIFYIDNRFMPRFTAEPDSS